ncbi:MAG: hypothetical protein WCT25_01580 [Candidatus Paceibacterota bacterium]|jgi:hypothetical protein
MKLTAEIFYSEPTIEADARAILGLYRRHYAGADIKSEEIEALFEDNTAIVARDIRGRIVGIIFLSEVSMLRRKFVTLHDTMTLNWIKRDALALKIFKVLIEKAIWYSKESGFGVAHVPFVANPNDSWFPKHFKFKQEGLDFILPL